MAPGILWSHERGCRLNLPLPKTLPSSFGIRGPYRLIVICHSPCTHLAVGAIRISAGRYYRFSVWPYYEGWSSLALTKFDVTQTLPLKSARARRTDDLIYHRFALFAIPVCISFISYVIKGFVQKKKGYFNFISTFCLVFFALVFIPWFINEYIRFLPTWMKILVIVPFFLVWISFPAMRRNATLMTVCYGYSFVIQIRIYHNNSLGIEYDDRLFNLLLGVSAIVMWTGPLISAIQQTLGHVYVR